MLRFQAIHARKVVNSTFFTWDELVDIISRAHTEGLRGPAASSMMGHDVMISNLWQVRNFWEWLAPGYTNDRIQAMSSAAFVPYDRLSSYHDFLIQKEDGSTADNVRVGLWAKRYMSDRDDTRVYLGTLVTTQMFNLVVGEKRPPSHMESTSDQKRRRESNVLKKLLQVTRGEFKDQFSAERLADAIALCRRDWTHFDDRPGTMPSDGRRQMLPRDLGIALMAAGKRRSGVSRALPRQAVPVDGAGDGPDIRIGGPVHRPARQLVHALAEIVGVQRGVGIDILARYGRQPHTEAEFLTRQPGLGGFVATRAILSSPMAKQEPGLSTMKFWTWRVIRVYQVGEEFDEPIAGRKGAAETTYESQLYVANARGVLRPCWNRMARATFIRTLSEKARNKRRRLLRSGRAKSSAEVRLPLLGYLRGGNVIGGGFHLTALRRVPPFVKQYLAQRCV